MERGNHILNLFIFGLFYLIQLHHVSAQKIYTKSDVSAMFPVNTKNLWINYLSGLIDEKHVIDMIIGTDGHTCKGLYTLRSSQTTFFFDGEDHGQHLRLAEINEEARLTGFIDGIYNGLTFQGSWLNKDKNLSLPLQLSFVNAFENFIPDARIDNQWIRTYKGYQGTKPYYIQIKREPSRFLCKYSDHTINKSIKIAELKGTNLEIIAPNFDSTILSGRWLMIDSTNLDKIDIIYPEENGVNVVSTLKIDEAIEFAKYEYADFNSRMECITLVTKSKRFDAWINATFNHWLEDHLKKFKSTDTDDTGTNERWVQNARGWVEVELFEDDIISGIIYMQSSLQTKTEKIPFIYDFRLGKELKLQDIFNGKFDSKAYFGNLMPEMIQITNWHPNVRRWFKNQSFNTICLKENGISFSTQFNTIYGEKEIIIPYEKVRQYLKPKYNF